MKKEQTLLLVLLFAAFQAFQAVAQQQTSTQSVSQISAASASRTNTPASTSATFTVAKSKLHLFGPAKPVQPQNGVRLIEGLDPRAWTTVVETRTSKSAFPSGETHEAGLCLLWWGSEPRTQ
jgi:hypothetical protein